MKSTISFKLLAVLALVVAGMAVSVSLAAAHGGHGGKGAKVDTDSDGASNRCEAQAGTDPAVADSDGDGIVDGLEDTDADGANNAAESKLRSNCNRANTRFEVRKRATVASFADGVLTLKIGSKGGLLAAPVSTRLVCEMPDPEDDDTPTASAARGGGDDGDDRGGRGRDGDDDHGHKHGRGHGHHHGRHHHDDTVACTTADLVANAVVRHAKVKRGKFVKIRLAGTIAE